MTAKGNIFRLAGVKGGSLEYRVPSIPDAATIERRSVAPDGRASDWKALTPYEIKVCKRTFPKMYDWFMDRLGGRLLESISGE